MDTEASRFLLTSKVENIRLLINILVKGDALVSYANGKLIRFDNDININGATRVSLIGMFNDVGADLIHSNLKFVHGTL